jgi:hypothetical protein
MLVLGLRGYYPLPNPKCENRSFFIYCPRHLVQFVQFIRHHSSYLENVSVRKLRKRHAVVTRGPPNLGPVLQMS